jgi:signal transduction histidine kinase
VKGLIHEIRNHLAVAVANTEGFRDGVLAPTPQRLDAVLQALAEADVLLGEVDLAGTAWAPNGVEPRSINVCKVVSTALVGFEAAASRGGITLSVHQCGTTVAACQGFYGDPVRIAEIVNNVMTNAIRYTPRGGAVDIDCHHNDGSLVLTVSDGGPGVQPAERERIFEAGYRGTAARGRGSGLGLAFAKRFVEAHGGSIAVDDAKEHGARFIITLPGTRSDVAIHELADGTLSLLGEVP